MRNLPYHLYFESFPMKDIKRGKKKSCGGGFFFGVSVVLIENRSY